MKLRTIKEIYKEINARNFGNVLTMPTILARRWRDALGQYETHHNKANTLGFNIKEIKGFAHARAIVYHEMTHQYIEEFLGLDEENHHGKYFWKHYRKFAPPVTELGELL